MRAARLLFLVAAIVTCGTPAHAGMPTISLTDVADARVESMSFFLVCFLACALAVKAIWNGLRKDFPRLPKLSYRAALGLLAVWGLLFVVVLTMISGARELLTPGAWEKKEGATYRLAGTGAPGAEERQQNLEDLRTALWVYAAAHENGFPPDAYVPEIPGKLWTLPRSLVRYVYVPGLHVDEGSSPLAYEPGVYEGERGVLLTSGEVRFMPIDELKLGLLPALEPRAGE